jgi:hypothetical protein
MQNGDGGFGRNALDLPVHITIQHHIADAENAMSGELFDQRHQMSEHEYPL